MKTLRIKITDLIVTLSISNILRKHCVAIPRLSIFCYSERHYEECHYDQWHYDGHRYNEQHYDECHYD
jgi:hypothetical protein